MATTSGKTKEKASLFATRTFSTLSFLSSRSGRLRELISNGPDINFVDSVRGRCIPPVAATFVWLLFLSGVFDLMMNWWPKDRHDGANIGVSITVITVSMLFSVLLLLRRLRRLKTRLTHECMVITPAVCFVVMMAALEGTSSTGGVSGLFEARFYIGVCALNLAGLVRTNLFFSFLVSGWLSYACVLMAALLRETSLMPELVMRLCLASFVLVSCGASYKVNKHHRKAAYLASLDIDTLRKTVENTKAVMSSIWDVVLELDEETCIITKECSMDGFFGLEIEGSTFPSLLAAQDQKPFQEALNSMSQQTSLRTTVNLVGTSSKVAEAEATVVRVRGGFGDGVVVFVVCMRLQDATVATSREGKINEQNLWSFNELLWDVAGPTPSTKSGTTRPAGTTLKSSKTVSDVRGTGLSRDPVDQIHSNSTSGPFTRGNMSYITECGRMEHWLIEPSELQFSKPVRVLGSGGFGQVSMAVLNGKAVAVKTTMQDAELTRLQALTNELRVLRRARHPNLVSFFGVVLEPERQEITLVFEWIHGSELTKYIIKVDPSPKQRYCIIVDVCCALWYLHQQKQPVVHGDMKSDNIMVESTRQNKVRSKVIDFGLATVTAATNRVRGKTRAWAAPELHMDPTNPAKTSGDVFSFGWLVHFVVTGQGPHLSKHGDNLKHAINKMVTAKQIDLPEVDSNIPYKTRSHALAKTCLAYEAAERPKIHRVHKTLVGWVNPQEAYDFGVEATVSMLPLISWRQWTVARSSGRSATKSVVMNVSLEGSIFRIVELEQGDEDLIDCLRPWVHNNLADYLVDPSSFHILVRSVLNDVKRGILCSPHAMHLEQVDMVINVRGWSCDSVSANVSDTDVHIYAEEDTDELSFLIIVRQRPRRHIEEDSMACFRSDGSSAGAGSESMSLAARKEIHDSNQREINDLISRSRSGPIGRTSLSSLIEEKEERDSHDISTPEEAPIGPPQSAYRNVDKEPLPLGRPDSDGQMALHSKDPGRPIGKSALTDNRPSNGDVKVSRERDLLKEIKCHRDSVKASL